jgi:metallophosphoesterase superfamily enzyme
MSFFTRLCVTYAFWKFVRWFDTAPWRNIFPAQRRTVTIVKRLPVVHDERDPRAGISAGDYFHALRNRRPEPDLSHAAFLAWRAKNNR